MKLFDEISNIYILVEPCDLRKGIDGYASIVRSEFHLDPMHTGNLYIFCNKHHNKLKCLYYDGTGFWLLYKRLESGTFKWIKSACRYPIMIEILFLSVERYTHDKFLICSIHYKRRGSHGTFQ